MSAFSLLQTLSHWMRLCVWGVVLGVVGCVASVAGASVNGACVDLESYYGMSFGTESLEAVQWVVVQDDALDICADLGWKCDLLEEEIQRRAEAENCDLEREDGACAQPGSPETFRESFAGDFFERVPEPTPEFFGGACFHNPTQCRGLPPLSSFELARRSLSDLGTSPALVPRSRGWVKTFPQHLDGEGVRYSPGHFPAPEQPPRG